MPQATATRTAAYIVVHTIGGARNDVERFETSPEASVDYAYTDALDAAAEIREHDGHYARIDSEYLDGERVIR